MENTQNIQNAQSTINAAAENEIVAQAQTIEVKAESKPKRAYHRLTDEEKAERAKAFEAYKAGVAERKAKRAEKKAAAEANFAARRNVEFDVSAITAAAADLASLSVAKVKDVRAKINALAAAVKEADKLMHHRAEATTITIK